MKKIFTLLFCTISAFSANAQIEILDNGKAVASGSTIVVAAHEVDINEDENDPFYMVEFEHNPFIYNKSSHNINTKLTVTKTKKEDNFSWCINNNCLPFLDMSLSQDFTIKAGAKEDLSLHPDEMDFEIGVAKTTTALFEVTANGKTQKFTIKFVYDPVSTGIEAQHADQITVANKKFSYNFANNADRILNVYGVSGRLVKTAALNQYGSVALNELQHGVYIYEVLTNGKRTATHKFVVR